MRYEPSEGSMFIDLPTIQSLELIQNLRDSKSKECLFGLLNQTLTPMGSRLLRCNILQPPTNQGVLEMRYAAVEELTTNEAVFLSIRQALRAFLDVDRAIIEVRKDICDNLSLRLIWLDCGYPGQNISSALGAIY